MEITKCVRESQTCLHHGGCNWGSPLNVTGPYLASGYREAQTSRHDGGPFDGPLQTPKHHIWNSKNIFESLRNRETERVSWDSEFSIYLGSMIKKTREKVALKNTRKNCAKISTKTKLIIKKNAHISFKKVQKKCFFACLQNDITMWQYQNYINAFNSNSSHDL